MDFLDHKTKSEIDSINRDLLAKFTPALLVTRDLGDQFVAGFTETISKYKLDQYIRYSTRRKEAWVEYLTIRFRQFLDDDEWFFLNNSDDNIPHLVGCRISAWDYDLFGVKMASIAVL